jgi:hypothetical protein
MRHLRAFLLAGLLLPLLDGVHTHWGVLSYREEWVWKMAWWVPWNFGLAGLALVWGAPRLEALLGLPSGPRLPDRIALGEAVLLASIYAGTGVFSALGNPAIAVALYSFLGVRLIWASEPGDGWYAVIVGIVGPLAEALLSSTGEFAYAVQDLWLVPMWLPALWGLAGIMIHRVMRHHWLGPPEPAGAGG